MPETAELVMKAPTTAHVVNVAPAPGSPVLAEAGKTKKHPGDLAKELGIKTLQDAHDKWGKVTAKWVIDHGTSPEDMVWAEVDPEGKPLFKRPPAGREMPEDEKIEFDKAVIAAAEKKISHDDERFKRIAPVDSDGFNLVPTQTAKIFADPAAAWWKEGLLEGEEELWSFQCGGMSGMPGRKDDELWGAGVLVLTKLNDGHRLHFFQLDECSEFEGSEAWKQLKTDTNTLGSESTEIQAETSAKYLTDHSAVYTVSNLKVEGNLFHCHATMDDSIKLASEFESTMDTRKGPCCACCNTCCTCDCMACCVSCCACMPCCWTNVKYIQGSWYGDTSYHVVREEFTDAVSEDISDGTAMEFPDVARHDATNRKAWRTSAKHYVRIMYWDTLSDSIAMCEVLLKKDEPFSKINQFVSYMGNLAAHPNDQKWVMTAPGEVKQAMAAVGAAAPSSSGASAGASSASGGSSSMTSLKGMRRMCNNPLIFCCGKVFFPPCTMFIVDGFSPGCCVPWVCCPCMYCYACCCWTGKKN